MTILICDEISVACKLWITVTVNYRMPQWRLEPWWLLLDTSQSKERIRSPCCYLLGYWCGLLFDIWFYGIAYMLQVKFSSALFSVSCHYNLCYRHHSMNSATLINNLPTPSAIDEITRVRIRLWLISRMPSFVRSRKQSTSICFSWLPL